MSSDRFPPGWESMSLDERQEWITTPGKLARWAWTSGALGPLGLDRRSHHSRQTEETLGELRETPARAAAIWTTYRQEVAAATSERMRATYQPQVIRDKVQQARTKALTALAELEQDAQARRALLAADAEAAVGAATNYHGDSTRAALTAQAWQRVRPLLDRSPT
jgi:chromosome segregation ATPase